MIYLSGTVVACAHPQVGWLLTPDSGYLPPPTGWLAADNACFSNPEGYSDDRYVDYLRTLPTARTLFATAPDAYGDHYGTVRRSQPMLGRIRGLGFHAAFVAQDGWTEPTTPWDDFDVLFVGGSTDFKFRGGRDAAIAAQRRGKPVHMGRVNSLERLRAAAAIGCASADGTFLKFAPDHNWQRMLRWFEGLNDRPGFAV
jgi:hypothetical protein